MKRLLPVLLAGFLLLPLSAHARTLFVNGSGPAGDGSSWNAPLADLNQALARAASGDAVWVAAGVYLPTGGTDREATFALKEGVSVYGGFAGNETELKRRDTGMHQTILSGDIGVPGNMEDNVYHVVTGANRALLDGFTITGGYSRNVAWTGGDPMTPASLLEGSTRGMGAGMLNLRTAPEVRDCLFQDNHALMGGAVYTMTSANAAEVPAQSPRFVNCIFWQNTAAGYGGGAANALRTRPLFVSCEFDSNVSDHKGGAMYNVFGAAPSLLNTMFRNNEAPLGGGLADEGGANPTLYYSTFHGNRALTAGPAIHQETGANVAVLIKTVVWGNTVETGDTRFFSAPGSEVRAQEAVIQSGFPGKLIFQANPGLDRKSETLLNTGYKTDDYRFRGDKLDARLRDIARFEVASAPPAFDPSLSVALALAVLEARSAAPMTASVPVVQPKPAVVIPAEPAAPAVESAPQAQPAPEAKAVPEPEALPEAKPEPEPALIPEPKSEALAMIAPQPAPQEKKSVSGTPEAMLLQYDMDGNGCITVNEAQGTLKQQFWRVDHNGDGCVSKAELQRMHKDARPVQAQAASPAPQARRAQPEAAKPVQTAVAKPRPIDPPAPVRVAPAPAPVRAAPAKSSGPSAGYTLFAPVGGTDTFLVDMQGKVVKKWTGQDVSTGSVHLLNNGNLLRTVTPPQDEVRTPFEGPDVNGGIIQEISPRGQIIWEYSYISPEVRQHHDIAPLPNGNILILAWEMKGGSALDAAGGALRAHPDGKVWAEHIVEVRKSGPRSGYIVWEWHSFDHLVQNANQSAPNYSSPVRLPQRIDLNYNPARQADWHHATSIAYNPALDQILLSVRNLNEIWIIDHSTTTAQAAGSEGGLMHRGGDLLFRWGNPAAYGAAGAPTLSSQYSAQWVDHGQPGEETILIFNNGDRRSQRSDILEIKPEYYLRSTRINAQVVWSYSEESGETFFAEQYSGAQRLDNGNTLIADNHGQRIVEVGPDGQPVWEYQAKGSRLLQATRIPLGHPGLKRLTLN